MTANMKVSQAHLRTVMAKYMPLVTHFSLKKVAIFMLLEGLIKLVHKSTFWKSGAPTFWSQRAGRLLGHSQPGSMLFMASILTKNSISRLFWQIEQTAKMLWASATKPRMASTVSLTWPIFLVIEAGGKSQALSASNLARTNKPACHSTCLHRVQILIVSSRVCIWLMDGHSEFKSTVTLSFPRVSQQKV